MICTICGKAGAYIRRRTNEVVCRMCPAIIPLKIDKEPTDQVKPASAKLTKKSS